MSENDHTTINCPYAERFGADEARSEYVISGIDRIEKHLETLNGRTRKNEVAIGKIMAVGALLIFLVPILIRVFWK